MEANHSSLVHEESSSTASISTAKEEKLLPGICLPTEEEKINDEVEKAAEVLVLKLTLHLLRNKA